MNKPVSISAVVFDLDGTLLDTEDLSSRAIQMSVGKFGKTFTWETKKKILGMRKACWAPIVIADLELEGQLSGEDLGREWEENLHELTPLVKKCKGGASITEFLERLRVPQGIATSSSAAAVRVKRRNHEDMFGRMQCIVTGDDPEVCEGKPAPDIYLVAAKRLGVDPRCCLAFEDAITGVQSAKGAGMFCVAVPDLRLDPDLFREAGADVVLLSLEEWDARAWSFCTGGNG
ncbi:unnamed protein product [Discosporangium mesarthrocarpum]